MNILVTGCNGFVGSALIDFLDSISDVVVTGVCRDKKYSAASDKKVFYISDFALLDDQHTILRTTDVLIHAAGKAHVMEKGISDDDEDYFLINTHMTLELAKRAAKSGVKRFIYLSSTKVFGEPKAPFNSFNLESPTNPLDPYGASKLKAELGLVELSEAVDLEVVIIRPPLVYGPRVKGNMRMLSKLVDSNLPLPFGSISTNKRSMVSIDNLVDLIWNCTTNPSANGQTFLVSDGHDVSTFEIINLFKKYLKSKTLVFAVPIQLLYLLGYATGSISKIRRLVESSVVDIEHTKTTLGWSPPQSVEKAFENMVK